MVSCTDDDDKDPNLCLPDIVMVGRCGVGIPGRFTRSWSLCGICSVIKCQYVSPYQCQVFQCLSSHIQLDNGEYTYYCLYGWI